MRVPADPEFLRHSFHELVLHPGRVRRLGESQTVRYALHVGIHHQRRLVVNVAEDQIAGFPSDPRQRNQLLNAVRHHAVEAFEQCRRTGLDIARLVAIEAGRADVLLQLSELRCSEVLQTAVLFEQLLRHHIYPGIRALSAQNRCKQQLPRVFTF